MEGKVRCEHCIMSRDAKGNWVFHADHLRAVTLAKIEVLESARSALDSVPQTTAMFGWLRNEIAALLKELEG